MNNIFDYLDNNREVFKITKPIRLIELFAGIGAQAKALENIGCNFEHYKVVEFDEYAINSYNAIHNTNFETQDILNVKAKDLQIVDKDIYIYICTYSFPCTDISLAGKGKGYDKGSNTRSSLLWEVERILNECNEIGSLPQVLLMENVPQVHSKKNKNNFNEWLLFLESLGYSNFTQDLNAKDYEIPQNRNRCFVVSILGNYKYEFPNKKPLKLKLQDLFEDNVDEKYFLSDKQINDISNWNAYEKPLETLKNTISKTLTTRSGDYTASMQLVAIKNNTKKGYLEACDGDGCYIQNIDKKCGTVQKEMIPTLKTQLDVGVVVDEPICLNSKVDGKQPSLNNRIYTSDIACTCTTNDYFMPNYLVDEKDKITNLRIHKLTPKECFRLMGFDDEDYEKASKVNSSAQLYKQAGNSIVVNVLVEIFKQLF